MHVVMSCSCGVRLKALAEYAGQMVTCPTCGAAVRIPSPGAQQSAVPAAPVSPEEAFARALAAGAPTRQTPPLSAPPKLRQPGKPPCMLYVTIDGAKLIIGFDVAFVLQAFVERFARKLRKDFDVQVVTAEPEAGLGVVVRVVSIDEGERSLRYAVSNMMGKASMYMRGHVLWPDGQRRPFHLRAEGGQAMAFGGSGADFAVAHARQIADQIARVVRKLA